MTKRMRGDPQSGWRNPSRRCTTDEPHENPTGARWGAHKEAVWGCIHNLGTLDAECSGVSAPGHDINRLSSCSQQHEEAHRAHKIVIARICFLRAAAYSMHRVDNTCNTILPRHIETFASVAQQSEPFAKFSFSSTVFNLSFRVTV